ncbi:hypothetical protein [Tanticharoenia sakaeratensis]|nr:hypothetical protein [Tanticharoenia sakaeratensis]
MSEAVLFGFDRECGVHGNGHGLIYEKNSDAALAPVLAWLASSVEASA